MYLFLFSNEYSNDAYAWVRGGKSVLPHFFSSSLEEEMYIFLFSNEYSNDAYAWVRWRKYVLPHFFSSSLEEQMYIFYFQMSTLMMHMHDWEEENLCYLTFFPHIFGWGRGRRVLLSVKPHFFPLYLRKRCTYGWGREVDNTFHFWLRTGKTRAIICETSFVFLYTWGRDVHMLEEGK
jgi:hypothetical protein